MLLGSIEAGGTKFVCAVGTSDYNVIEQTQFSTTTPKQTLSEVVAFFKNFEIDALSISSFGPIEVRDGNSKYGFITNTPKPGWQNTDFVGVMKKNLHVPIFWTTDVNGSAFGEYIQTSNVENDVHSLVYYTIGTGVGAGIVTDGKFCGTLGHPEMGHIFVKRHPDDIGFDGCCPFHGDCLEGLVAGPTFEARLGQKGSQVSKENPVWNIMAYYVAQAAAQVTLTLRPNKIVFGGGVTNSDFLRKIRSQFAALLNDYVNVPDLENYLSMPLVENNGSATVGNFALAKRLLI